MSTTVSASTASTTTDTRTPRLWRAGAVAGGLAAAATTVVAAAAQAIDVPIEVAGESIPLFGFAQLTLFCTVLGVLLAKGAHRWASNARTAFVRTTVALTALSLVPDLTADTTTATIVVLMLTHLVAAAIVKPRLANRLEGVRDPARRMQGVRCADAGVRAVERTTSALDGLLPLDARARRPARSP